MNRLSDRTLRVIAWSFVAWMVLAVAGSLAMDRASGTTSSVGFAIALAIFPVIGLIIVLRSPRTTLGWLMLAMGLMAAVFSPLGSFGAYALDRHPGSAAGGVALALNGPSWILFIALSGYLLLLFPDGHLPSARWRWFAWACGTGLCVLGVFIAVAPGTFDESGFPAVSNPIGIEALDPYVGIIFVLAALAPILVLGGAVAIVLRLRRATDDVERHQLRWLAYAAAVIAVLYGLSFAFNNAGWAGWLQALGVMSFALIPISIGIAVLRYRLYDIDIVIRKTVVLAVLAGSIALIYAGIVTAIGVFVGDRSSGLAPAIAAACVALAFQPIARWARRLADRIVYGNRATPYEVLAELGEHLGDAYASDDVLVRMARVLAEGTGADRAQVLLRVGDELRVVASWPADARAHATDDFTTDVMHQGEPLGALSVSMPPSDPMNPTKERLVRDLAGQAGLVLRNVRLTEELRGRLVDLQATQRRLVTAQDEERRKLERNIHDGAQQQLVALTVKLRLARTMLERDPAKADTLLDQMQGESQQALEDLRDLARGIYPPVLADKGLAAALEAQGRKSPVPVEVDADGVGRYPREIEAAAYFSCLEAMQNVAKYARASAVRIELRQEADTLVFRVTDDGVGFDPADTGYGTGLQGIADRLAVLDGSMTVDSAPGSGTTVTGSLPGSVADAMVNGASSAGVAASESAGAGTR